MKQALKMGYRLANQIVRATAFPQSQRRFAMAQFLRSFLNLTPQFLDFFVHRQYPNLAQFDNFPACFARPPHNSVSVFDDWIELKIARLFCPNPADKFVWHDAQASKASSNHVWFPSG